MNAKPPPSRGFGGSGGEQPISGHPPDPRRLLDRVRVKTENLSDLLRFENLRVLGHRFSSHGGYRPQPNDTPPTLASLALDIYQRRNAQRSPSFTNRNGKFDLAIPTQAAWITDDGFFETRQPRTR